MNPSIKIAIYSARPYEGELFEATKPKNFELIYINDWLRPETASLAKGCEGVILFVNDDAGKESLTALHSIGVKVVALRSAGFDHVDLKTAKELGISIANVPKYPPNAVAEMAVAMMMALNRHLILASQHIDHFDFRLNGLIGFNFAGKTVGIIGLGNIGQVTARIMHGFGCQVLAYDPVPDAEFQKENLAEFVSLDNLLAQSHIISLHCPLNEHTKYIINTDSIQKMRQGVMLINTGRGGLIDTKAALKGIKSGRIGYLGLDVYEREKGVFFNDRSNDMNFDPVLKQLTEHANILVTGHQGFFTKESLEAIIKTTFSNLAALLSNNNCENRLT
jgi:D-lactate dehydrogenase